MIILHFTCGEEKIWYSLKMSQNVNHNFLGCETRQEFCNLILDWYYNIYVQSVFSSNMTMISYFNIIVNIIILKMFIASLVMTISLLKCFFHHATAIFTFFDYIINKFVNYVPRLNMFQKHHKTYQYYILIYCHNCKQYGFDICLYKVIFNGKKNRKLACNFTKSITLPWLFFKFVILHKWYQIRQRITYNQSQYYWSNFLQNQKVWKSPKHSQREEEDGWRKATFFI